MTALWNHVGVLVVVLTLRSPAAEAGGGNSSAAASTPCPLDLRYVSTFPWDRAPCAPPVSNRTACCTTLLSVLGIGLAERLRATGRFRLPSEPASAACLRNFSDTLAAPPISLPNSLVADCFPDQSQFAISPAFCAGVTNAAQYVAVVGHVSVAQLNASCGADLTSMSVCSRCLDAGIDATYRLTVAAGNGSKSLSCFYLTVIYAAGISSSAGPNSLATAKCVLGLALSTPSPASSPASSSTNHTNIAVAATISIASVLLVSLVALLLWRKRDENIKNRRSIHLSAERRSRPRPNTGSVLFDIGELAKATGGFAERNVIGRGGFGVVYRGVIPDGTVVAVKKMLDPDVEGGDEEFTNEVEIISQLRHRNLVPLRGCCIADDDVDQGKQMFLVYDYMPKGSLDQYIFEDGGEAGRRRPPAFSWTQRRTVILDVARGLEYLHYGVKPGIFHRDIKANNILLDEDMRASLADFGLARRSREGQSHLTTRVAGTHGYLSPEYALYGQLTEKSDVYSFGVLVLEVMSGRHALDLADPSGVVLITDWAWTLIKAGRAKEVLAEALREEPSTSVAAAMERFVFVGILCAHVTVACRPTMPEALRMLEGDAGVPELPDRPQPFGQRIAFDVFESNFSASSVMSGGPFMDFGDMLR